MNADVEYKRIVSNLKRSHKWENWLRSTNDLFYQGKEKRGQAVRDYGKILEILLRDLYKEISMMIPEVEKRRISETAQQIGKTKPIGKFGFGQLIALFSRSGLFRIIRRMSGTDVLNGELLNKINKPRIDQTHYDEETTKEEVEEFRKYTTKVLLELQLISEDPDPPVELKEARLKSKLQREGRQKRMENLRRMLSRIRLGLAGKESLSQNYEIDDYGRYYHVEIEGEIIGLYLENDETITALVKLEDTIGHEDIMEQMYEGLISEVRRIIEEIEHQTKDNLNVLIFDDQSWPDVMKAVFWEDWASK